MLIDWFTVGAQTLNFLVLVWLLKRFLYRPVLQAVDAREQRVAAELADADARKAEARQERDDLGHKSAEFDRERAALFSKATDEAKAERQRLLDAARQEAESKRALQENALRTEQQSLSAEISRRTREEVFAIARKTLGDLAGTSLEERMVDVLLRRVQALSEPEREGLQWAFQAASGSATVRTTFELSADQQRTVKSALGKILPAEAPLRFECAPDLISGIQLTANGSRIEWSIADYLGSLERSVGELLQPASAAP